MYVQQMSHFVFVCDSGLALRVIKIKVQPNIVINIYMVKNQLILFGKYYIPYGMFHNTK